MTENSPLILTPVPWRIELSRIASVVDRTLLSQLIRLWLLISLSTAVYLVLMRAFKLPDWVQIATAVILILGIGGFEAIQLKRTGRMSIDALLFRILTPQTQPGAAEILATYQQVLQQMRTLAEQRPEAESGQSLSSYWAKDVDSLLLLGRLHFLSGRFAEAARSWELAVQHTPSGMAFRGLGAARLHLGQLSEAVDAFRRSLEIEPSANAYASLGVALFQLARYEDAVRMFEKAIAMDPERASYWGTLGRLRASLGDEKGAGQALDHAIELLRSRLEAEGPHARAWVVLAQLLVQRGMLAEAVVAARNALTLAPDDPASMMTMATISLRLGRQDEALGWLARLSERGFGVSEIQAWESFQLPPDLAWGDALIRADDPWMSNPR